MLSAVQAVTIVGARGSCRLFVADGNRERRQTWGSSRNVHVHLKVVKGRRRRNAWRMFHQHRGIITSHLLLSIGWSALKERRMEGVLMSTRLASALCYDQLLSVWFAGDYTCAIVVTHIVISKSMRRPELGAQCNAVLCCHCHACIAMQPQLQGRGCFCGQANWARQQALKG